jgi:Zn-dependent peptidase ImmA (M78 family)/transcriptional regulator with XRE-family HTH domain
MEQASVTEQQLADRCGVSPQTVTDWLAGAEQPSKTQFKKLAALLRRQSAFFFLPQPPAHDAVPAAFRHPPGESQGRILLPEEANAIRRARRFQRVSEWVLTSSGAKAHPLPVATVEDSTEHVAALARRYFNWSPQDQFNSKDISAANRALRDRLEGFGFIVLHFPLGEQGCRGFSLYNKFAPVIAVNTAYNIAARTFSYGHELGHLILQSDSICANRSDYAVEKWCDSFSAAFLMPRAAVENFLEQELPDREKNSVITAQRLAGRFKVSLRAAAIRLIDLKFEPPQFYQLVDRGDFKSSGGGGGGETSPEKRLREWGTTYPQLLLSAEERKLLTRQDVLEYLNLSNSQFNTFRELLASGSSVGVAE